LDRDREVAAREGLDMGIEQSDMRDLGRRPPGRLHQSAEGFYEDNSGRGNILDPYIDYSIATKAVKRLYCSKDKGVQV
jgi:hypothetical protein